MLRDLQVKNYRCLQDFSVEGLAQINLIVGENNIGKTSLLEAIYLLSHHDDLAGASASLFEILQGRGEYSRKTKLDLASEEPKEFHLYPVSQLFYGHRINSEVGIQITTTTEVTKTLEIKISASPEGVRSLEFCDVKTSWSPGDFNIQENEQIETLQIFPKRSRPYRLLLSRRLRVEDLAVYWDKISLTPKEDSVLESLRILEPDVERIGFVLSKDRNMVQVQIRGYDHPVPLSSMGEGMRQLLTLAVALVTAEDGVLLVDDIDTGLYYETQVEVWRLIIKTAQQFNIQVFTTAHSWDCIDAFQEALAELKDMSIAKLFRIDRKHGKLRAVEYNAEELEKTLNQSTLIF